MKIQYDPQCPKCGYPLVRQSEDEEFDGSEFGRHCIHCDTSSRVHLSIINHYTVTLEDNADGR